MIIDSSAIVAILRSEPTAPDCLLIMEQAHSIRMSAASLLEVSIVLESQLPYIALDDLDMFLASFEVEIAAVTESQARIARIAHRRFGRGTHNDSKAKLNFGDCFTYALARENNEPLLFVGDDFSHTDITPALKA